MARITETKDQHADLAIRNSSERDMLVFRSIFFCEDIVTNILFLSIRAGLHTYDCLRPSASCQRSQELCCKQIQVCESVAFGVLPQPSAGPGGGDNLIAGKHKFLLSTVCAMTTKKLPFVLSSKFLAFCGSVFWRAFYLH